MRSPLASFDALALIGAAVSPADGLTLGEVHTLDYLACLIAIYDGRPASWWGIRFSVTETGAPLAREISAAVEASQQAHWLEREEAVFRLTAAGQAELEFEVNLAPNRPRVRYLKAASSAALTMPLPAISDSLAHEPGLRRALTFMRRKQLLDETSLGLVSEQFESLTEGLGVEASEQEDLMVPTAVWLTYLSETADVGEQAA